MDAREVDSNAVPFSGPLPRSNLNQKLALRLALRMGALHSAVRPLTERFQRVAKMLFTSPKGERFGLARFHVHEALSEKD